MKNSKSVNPVVFLITFFIIIFAISLLANDYAQVIANGKPIDLNNGWILVSDESQDLELDSLPVDLIKHSQKRNIHYQKYFR